MDRGEAKELAGSFLGGYTSSDQYANVRDASTGKTVEVLIIPTKKLRESLEDFLTHEVNEAD